MKQPVIISVGGGKGGIGKSVIIANVGALLAAAGFKVGFLDADFSGANLHTFLGVRRPKTGINDFFSGRIKSLIATAVPTVVPGSWLISGLSDNIELANPKVAQRQQLIAQISSLPADYLLIDLGAGATLSTCDFFAAFSTVLLVTDGLPTSLENAYAFLKNGVVRSISRLFPGDPVVGAHLRRFSDFGAPDALMTIDHLVNALGSSAPRAAVALKEWLARRKTFLVLNMVRETGDIACGQRFAGIVKKYLSLNLTYIGYIIYSEAVRQSIRQGKPVVILAPSSRVTECFTAVSRNVTALTAQGK
jgi:flagellar biosynthesis protein FlhG